MTLESLFIKSWNLAKPKPSWWGLAFFQIGSFVWLLKLSQFELFYHLSLFGFLFVFLIFVFSFVTVSFWLDILKQENAGGNFWNLSFFSKLELVLKVFIVVFFGLSLSMVLERILNLWVLFALLNCLLFVSVMVIILYLISYRMTINKAVLSAVNFWQKQFGLLFFMALVVLLVKTYVFIFLSPKTFFFFVSKVFPIFSTSGTILLLPILVCFSFLGAVLNTFIVLSFSEINKGLLTKSTEDNEPDLAIVGA